MLLNLAHFTKFLRERIHNIPQAWLVFGNDSGSVQRSCEILINAMSKIPLSGDRNPHLEIDIIRMPNEELGGLYDEIFGLSLFPRRKIIIADYHDSSSKLYLDIVKHKIPPYINIIIKGAEIKKNTKIRNVFETSSAFIALHCYEQGRDYIIKYIIEYYRSKKIDCSIEVASRIYEYYSGNIALLQRELEKLMLYSQDLSEEVVDKVMSGEHTMILDNLLQALAKKDIKAIILEIWKAESNEITGLYIIRLLQIYISRVIGIKQLILTGLNLEAALSELKLYLFGKAKESIILGVNNLEIKYCYRFLHHLTEAEIMMKSKLINSNHLAATLLCLFKAEQ